MPNSLRRSSPILVSLLAVAAAACDAKNGLRPEDDRIPGQTDFTSVEQGVPGRGAVDHAGGVATGAGGTGSGPATANPTPSTPGAPSGRVAEVEEADIYKLVGTRLYYFNTYRGFIIYDVTDAAKPVVVSRLPVYGYPVEMFVEGNVVYALLRDALYLTQVQGQVQFQRHNVSQLVTIDVSDNAHPRLLKSLDIIGQLHEGVSRKIDDTIYVVSEQWQGYYWGWPGIDQNNESQAWVYSYDVSDPTNPRQAGQLQIFQGNGSNSVDSNGNISSQTWFSGVNISATANALMVVESWYTYDYRNNCTSSAQKSVVSVIDVSDPTGVIRRHTRFETDGTLSDQFKMTYRFDEATGKGTFFGVFFQQSWSCTGGTVAENRLESWDITDGGNPQRLASLAFGKDNEMVRGTAFDLSRNVLYAITARQIDPLYAIDIANPAAPRIRSQIDGLSGSISVFRSVGGGQFLMGIGQDQSATCAGVQDGDPSWLNTKMAVSIIDVRDLANIRLAQRRCITLPAGTSSGWSSLTWNMDQAHKMLGMFQDGDVNLLTVPVSYYSQDNAQVGWWYHWQTAVGILTWDLSRYDATKPPEQQTIVQSYGTFVHPEGEVTRSILFRHPTSGRTMINVSDTHLSIANIDNLAQPRLQSIVEVAPSVNEVYGFGDYVVERVDRGGYWSPTGVAEFRVKRAGGPIDEKAPVATFQIGQAARVQRFKQTIVVLRYIQDTTNATAPTTEAVVFDLADPTHPRLASRLAVPFNPYNYYGFYCGMGFWGGYWFGTGQQTVTTDTGIVDVRTDYRYDGTQYTATPTVTLLDLRDPSNPRVVQSQLPGQDANNYWGWYTAVDDPAAPSGFYLARRDYLGNVQMGTSSFQRYKYFAQRYETGDGKLTAGASINLPGPLAKTWVDGAGKRRFLTSDFSYRTLQYPDRTEWHGDTRLNLLAQVDDRTAALTDAHLFADLNLGSLIVDRDRLFVSAQKLYYWSSYPAMQADDPQTWESTSDRLMIFDLGAGKLSSLYDRPTRTYGVRLMGMNQGRLFISLPGDGVLLTNVSDPANPRGVRFLRTLGWGSYIEPVNNDAYVAGGSFGVFDLDLTLPADIPVL